MTFELSHEELQELLPAAAIEILEGGELERIMAHISSCPECAEMLDQYRAVAAALSARLSPHQLRPDRATAVRSRLMARVGAERTAKATTHRSLRTLLPFSGWLVAAGVASVLLVHHSIHRPVDYGWLVAGVLGLILLAVGVYALIQRARVASLRSTLAGLQKSGLPGNERGLH